MRAALLLLLLPVFSRAAPLLPLPPLKSKPPAKAAPKPAPVVEEEPAGDEEEEEAGEESSLFLGVSGSLGREANVDDHDWGPTVSLDLVTTDEDSPTRLRYGLEASYNDASTRFRGSEGPQATRVKAFNFRYARVSLLKLAGFDLRERLGLVPFVAGGVQHVNSLYRETVENDDGVRSDVTTTDNYWSPSWGVGAEIRLNSRLNLILDYSFNGQRYVRRVERLSLEMKVRVFGAEE